jgi:DNA-binding IclR family transcriptional regulator
MKQHSKNKPMPGTQAITRAFTVLRALSAARDGLGITEIASATNLSKATVFRALHALEAEMMVTQQSAGASYHLGPGLIVLGNSAVASLDLRTTAREELLFLSELTGEMATLEVPLGSEVLILEEIQGRYLLGSTSELGRRWPAHATSTGKLFLALSQKVTIPARLEKLAPRTITSRKQLNTELERILKHGYASAVDELEPGFAAVAAPVRDHTGAVIAALSINGPKSRLGPSERKAVIEPLCNSANRVSRKLGAAEPFLSRHDAAGKFETVHASTDDA